ncbi:ATP-binding protein [Streptomyces antarcticus]|uniref:ATP-binding protein n=1 Tax=Streptomyces antarcticus TaxID=2996458 RepID=UPI00226E8FD9|nr:MULTISPECIES: ATP-binding protein [unclassified Streptomyces]MCY0946578.1 ATP-binding protein [Streptomyces sp. H34-AA3]MCZ4086754.1 ATP-binding protein [Streptomyces sp. H34-S5]
MISHSRRHCVVELQALPCRIGQIRRIVSAQLRHWQLDPLIDRAALGVTELLSNVHRHAQPDKTCTVEIELRLGRLTVSVIDSDPRLPVLREVRAEALDTCGRGLALVEAVSEAWGARNRSDGSGKVVWFSLRAAPASAPPARPVRISAKPVREPARTAIVAVEPAAVPEPLPVAASASLSASLSASASAPAAASATAPASASAPVSASVGIRPG